LDVVEELFPGVDGMMQYLPRLIASGISTP
jgi:hypothetical protein